MGSSTQVSSTRGSCENRLLARLWPFSGCCRS
jgi:hypothetical protein